MDRARFLPDLVDYLDGAASVAQVEGLAEAMKADPKLNALAAEYALQDNLLEACLAPAPALAPAAVILKAAKRRAAIVGGVQEGEPATAEAGLLEAKTKLPKKQRALPSRSLAKAHGLPAAKRRGARGRGRLAARGAPPVRRGASKSFLAALAAAALLLLAAGAWFFMRNNKPRPPGQTAQKEPPPPARTLPPEKAKPQDPIVSIAGVCERKDNTLRTDHRSSAEVQLADGSVVELQPNTIIRFAEPTAEVRQDLDMQQGLLKVRAAKDRRTFRIRVGHGELTVRGTRFIVEVPRREMLAAGQPPPARIEVIEGSVRLKNAHGERVLEREQSAVLCDAFPPQSIARAIGHEFLGFSGVLHGQVLGKNREGMLFRVSHAKADRENELHHPERLVHHIVRLFVPGERFEGAHEHARRLLEALRVMGEAKLAVWSHQHRFLFSAPKR